MRIKTEYLASKEMASAVGATWAMADGTYTFSILSVRTSKGGNAMFATTIGYAMVGAVLKAATPKAKELLTEGDQVSYDSITIFNMVITNKTITRVGSPAPVAAPVAPVALATGD